MASLLGAASIPFIACISLLAAMVLQILSFAAPYWAYSNTEDIGLWRRTNCVQRNGVSGCYRTDHLWYYYTEWIDAVRAMEALTIIFWAIPLIVLPVYIYVALGLYYRCTIGTMTVLTILGAITNLIGVIIFGAKIGENSAWRASWSLILCVIACGLGIVAFVFLLIACCKKPPKFIVASHFHSAFYVDPDRNRMYVVEDVEQVKNGTIIGGIGQINPVLEDD
ncbi:uncharacterized protein LOC131929578 [Physella acuta]|uniref:uncharacterized protein LOC131929578 n=1 Tax=Physella acuta TaxID=109671 RepID=UPI0027DDF49B|nr:uncharacterized protein LOC131929578 [Physella acuta]